MRYQKIHSQIWNDEKFTSLSPSQQRLFLYILTCPHGNISGFFVLKQGYICDDLKCLPKDLAKDLPKLVEVGLIEYDFTVSVILIKRYLKHNPITNDNQKKAVKKMLRELPKTELFQRFEEVLPEVLKEELKEVLHEVKLNFSYSYSVSVSVSSSEKGDGESLESKKDEKTSHGNILLTEKEYEKLKSKFNSQLQDVLDFMNLKIESKGIKEWRKQYKSDYATILLWDRNGWIKPNGTQPEKTHVMDKIEMAARGLI